VPCPSLCAANAHCEGLALLAFTTETILRHLVPLLGPQAHAKHCLFESTFPIAASVVVGVAEIRRNVLARMTATREVGRDGVQTVQREAQHPVTKSPSVQEPVVERKGWYRQNSFVGLVRRTSRNRAWVDAHIRK